MERTLLPAEAARLRRRHLLRRGYGGSVIVFFGPCRESGFSRLTWDVACHWAQAGWRVALVDADLALGGSLADIAGCSPQPNAGDLVGAGGAVGDAVVLACTLPVRPGVRLLAAPTRPDRARAVAGAPLGRFIGQLRSGFDLIAVDLPPRFDATAVAVLSQADVLLMLVGLDAATLPRVARALEMLRLIEFPSRRLFWSGAIGGASGDDGVAAAFCALFEKGPLAAGSAFGTFGTNAPRDDELPDRAEEGNETKPAWAQALAGQLVSLVGRCSPPGERQGGSAAAGQTARTTLPAFKHLVQT